MIKVYIDIKIFISISCKYSFICENITSFGLFWRNANMHDEHTHTHTLKFTFSYRYLSHTIWTSYNLRTTETDELILLFLTTQSPELYLLGFQHQRVVWFLRLCKISAELTYTSYFYYLRFFYSNCCKLITKHTKMYSLWAQNNDQMRFKWFWRWTPSVHLSS